MNWLELHIDTNHSGLTVVETLLSSLGIDGVVIDDETEFQEFLEHNHQYWDYVDEELTQRMQGRSRITFYLEENEAGFAKLGEVRIALDQLKRRRSDCGTLLMTLENLQDSDWENNWKQYYKPMEIGERLLGFPSGSRQTPRIGSPWCWTQASPSAPAATPPPGSASQPWNRRSTAERRSWTWAAAAASSPSPP